MTRLRLRAKSFYCVLAVTLLLAGCTSVGCKRLDAENCEVLEDFGVFGPGDELHFDHHCSDPEHAYGASRGAYVFFEAEDEGSAKMLVLSHVSLGWVFGPRGGQGLLAQLHRIQARSLEDWKGDEFSLNLVAEEIPSGEMVSGDSMAKYVESGSELEPQTRAFEISPSGGFDWEQFVEPDQEKAEETRNVYKFSDVSDIRIEALRTLDATYRLSLFVRNSQTGEELRLHGPTLSGLPAHLDIEKPEASTLGLLATLNPAQQGGLWHWLRTAATYGDCIYTRRAAKQMFAARFAN